MTDAEKIAALEKQVAELQAAIAALTKEAVTKKTFQSTLLTSLRDLKVRGLL